MVSLEMKNEVKVQHSFLGAQMRRGCNTHHPLSVQCQTHDY